MQDKIMKLIKDSSITIPKLLLFNYKKLNMKEQDLIMIIYLMSLKELQFNPAQISEDLGMSLQEVMIIIDSLTNLNLVRLESKKIDNIRQDIINLDNIYNKLLYLIINEEEKEEQPTDIYSTFESEFGRTLAPMEYEIINSWIDSGYSEELIISALKEAVYNGVFKLNYIDKILYEWDKKGIKNIKDIEKDKEKFSKQKEEKKDLYDYNWLEDDN